MLKLEKINKSFGNNKILFDIDSTINKGEIVGIIGPNGAGKSTTMKIITGFYIPNSGDVKINNESIFKNNNLKKKIGYLAEVNPLYEDMGVDEFLSFTAGLKGLKENKKKEEIENVLKMTNLVDKKMKFINTLSKGYKQRVGLAAALIGNPDILVLDEPTEGLDPNQRDEIKSLIKKLGETKTILISSHVLTELSDLVNRVIIISNGKITLDDTIKNIEVSNSGKTIITIIYAGKINKEKLKEKFDEVSEIKEISKKEINITLNKDIRRKLIGYLVNEYNILEFYSKKINLSDIFFENIK